MMVVIERRQRSTAKMLRKRKRKRAKPWGGSQEDTRYGRPKLW